MQSTSFDDEYFVVYVWFCVIYMDILQNVNELYAKYTSYVGFCVEFA